MRALKVYSCVPGVSKLEIDHENKVINIYNKQGRHSLKTPFDRLTAVFYDGKGEISQIDYRQYFPEIEKPNETVTFVGASQGADIYIDFMINEITMFRSDSDEYIKGRYFLEIKELIRDDFGNIERCVFVAREGRR